MSYYIVGWDNLSLRGKPDNARGTNQGNPIKVMQQVETNKEAAGVDNMIRVT